MILRPTTAADAPAVAALEAELFGVDAWPLQSVLADLSGEGRFAVLAVSGDGPVGYAMTLGADDVVDLLRLGVDPSHRRQGVGHAMLGAALDRAASDGARRMMLEVSASNSSALGFYRSEGFAEIDRRPRYYRDGSDALVLGRSLVRPPGPAQSGRG